MKTIAPSMVIGGCLILIGITAFNNDLSNYPPEFVKYHSTLLLDIFTLYLRPTFSFLLILSGIAVVFNYPGAYLFRIICSSFFFLTREIPTLLDSHTSLHAVLPDHGFVLCIIILGFYRSWTEPRFTHRLGTAIIWLWPLISLLQMWFMAELEGQSKEWNPVRLVFMIITSLLLHSYRMTGSPGIRILFMATIIALVIVTAISSSWLFLLVFAFDPVMGLVITYIPGVSDHAGDNSPNASVRQMRSMYSIVAFSISIIGIIYLFNYLLYSLPYLLKLDLNSHLYYSLALFLFLLSTSCLPFIWIGWIGLPDIRPIYLMSLCALSGTIATLLWYFLHLFIMFGTIATIKTTVSLVVLFAACFVASTAVLVILLLSDCIRHRPRLPFWPMCISISILILHVATCAGLILCTRRFIDVITCFKD